MLNLSFNIIYHYTDSEWIHILGLRRKYGKRFQLTFGKSNKRVWYDGERASKRIKNKIARSLLLGSRFRCSYCAKRLTRVTRQIDHFIPNAVSPDLSFHVLNLLPSCGYCNATLKLKFNPVLQRKKKYAYNEFLILHPMLHDVDNHIFYTDDDRTLFDYNRCTLLGLNTIEAFELYSEEMRDERINQFIIDRDNPLTDEKLLRLVEACAMYQVR